MEKKPRNKKKRIGGKEKSTNKNLKTRCADQSHLASFFSHFRWSQTLDTFSFPFSLFPSFPSQWGAKLRALKWLQQPQQQHRWQHQLLQQPRWRNTNQYNQSYLDTNFTFAHSHPSSKFPSPSCSIPYLSKYSLLPHEIALIICYSHRLITCYDYLSTQRNELYWLFI